MQLNSYKYREIQKDEWNHHWSKINQVNLMQSWEYGESKVLNDGWKSFHFLFEDSDNNPIALAQILTKSLSFLGGVARLNRGPLLIGENNYANNYKVKLELIEKLTEIAKLKKWWLFYMAPEILMCDSRDDAECLKQLKVRNNIVPWASARLSLEPDENILMKNLNGKWRNLLRKSHKNDLKVSKVSLDSTSIDDLIEFYQDAQKGIGFSGISPGLLRSLSHLSNDDWEFCHYVAKDKSSSEQCGVLVSIIHGDTSTYLIGNTNICGRKLNANYAMLWNAILEAKLRGCKWFDLGGLNDNTPKGVAHFKSGLNGEKYQLIGEILIIPILN